MLMIKKKKYKKKKENRFYDQKEIEKELQKLNFLYLLKN